MTTPKTLEDMAGAYVGVTSFEDKRGVRCLKSDDINKILNNPEQKMNDFRAGFHAALELPEVNEMARLVKSFVEEGDDTYCTCGVELGSEESWRDPECLYHESIQALAQFKKFKGGV